MLGAGHGIAWQAGWTKVTTPFDVVLTLGPTESHDDLRAPRDGVRRIAVILHGVGRSAWSMWKIERLLAQHGYEVWNETYDGASFGIRELGADLQRRLEARLQDAPNDVELYAVAHSMGGLVLRCYTAHPDARRFAAMVFLGTPNRGATMAEQMRDGWPFRTFLGTKAARDLAPSAGVVADLPRPPRLGNVIGGRGDDEGRSSMIPGDDDGRVGVAEAHLADEVDSVLLDVSHTFLPTDDRALEQVLQFFRHGRFDHSGR